MALRKAEGRYRSLVEHLPAVIYIAEYGPQGRWSYVSPQIQQLLGFSPQEWIADPAAWANQLHPEDKERAIAQGLASAEKRESFVSEYRMLTRDGRVVWVRDEGTILLGEAGTTQLMQGVMLDITGSKTAQKTLQEVEVRLATMVSNAPVVLFALDKTGVFTLSEGRGLQALGLKQGELLGRSVFDHYRDHPPILANVRRALSGEEFTSIAELPELKLTYETRWTPDRDRSGNLLGVIGVATDVSERKQAEAAGQITGERHSIALEASGLSIWDRDVATGKVCLSEGWSVTLGGEPKETKTTLQELLQIAHPDDRERLWNVAFETLKDKISSYREEHRVRNMKGEWLWIESTGEVVERDQNGRALRMVGTNVDISERKRTEAKRMVISETSSLDELFQLIHRELKKVIYAENCFIAFYDRQSNLFSFPFFVDKYDMPPPPHKAERSCMAYVLRSDRPQLIPDELAESLAAQGEIEIVGTNSPSWLGVPLKSPSEMIGALVVQHYEKKDAYTQRDVEFLSSVASQIAIAIERKRREEALKLSEANHRSMMAAAPYGIYCVNTEGKFLFVNPALVEMLGYDSAQELLSININEGVYGSLEERARLIHEHPDGMNGVEVDWKRKDGQHITARLAGRPVHDASGAVAYYEVIAEDVTEKRKLERQLLQAQKMEAVGRLAGGIAHDFNNLLMVINGQLELLHGKSAASDPRTQKIEQAQKAADRAAALTRQLLAFSRMQVLQPKIINLNAVVTEISKLLVPLLGANIELAIQPDQNLGCVKADPGQIEQVILNLAVNARDAMPKGGRLGVETANVELDETYARLHPPLTAGHYVMLAVSDTGMGMDAETQGRIFEPFFTTKEKGKGTGLGLATVYGIVKQSNGYIWVDSKPGQGTRFTVHLPLVEEPADSREPVKVSSHPLAGTETILLAEDENDVREVAREFLTQSGYTVIEAKNGGEALEIAKKYPHRIHVLLTDMVMPGISGSELAKQMASVRPETRVVYMSGYSQYTVFEQKDVDPDAVLLQKPFTRDSLARAVRHVIDGE